MGWPTMGIFASHHVKAPLYRLSASTSHHYRSLWLWLTMAAVAGLCLTARGTYGDYGAEIWVKLRDGHSMRANDSGSKAVDLAAKAEGGQCGPWGHGRSIPFPETIKAWKKVRKASSNGQCDLDVKREEFFKLFHTVSPQFPNIVIGIDDQNRVGVVDIQHAEHFPDMPYNDVKKCELASGTPSEEEVWDGRSDMRAEFATHFHAIEELKPIDESTKEVYLGRMGLGELLTVSTKAELYRVPHWIPETRLDEEVVVKVINTRRYQQQEQQQIDGNNAAAMAKLVAIEAEAKILLALKSFPKKSHFLTRLLKAFKTQNNLYMVMEDGGEDFFNVLDMLKRYHPSAGINSAEWDDRLSLPWDEKDQKEQEHFTRFWIGQLVEALDFLHALGVVFGDIKPENILLTSEGDLKLTDFGCARVLGAPAETMLVHGCGTLFNLAPESLEVYLDPSSNKAVAISQKTDIWEAGLVVYRMALRRHPFEVFDRYGYLKFYATLEKILEGEPYYESEEEKPTPYLPALLEALVKVMLDKNPETRPTAAKLKLHEALASEFVSTAKEEGGLGEQHRIKVQPPIDWGKLRRLQYVGHLVKDKATKSRITFKTIEPHYSSGEKSEVSSSSSSSHTVANSTTHEHQSRCHYLNPYTFKQYEYTQRTKTWPFNVELHEPHPSPPPSPHQGDAQVAEEHGREEDDQATVKTNKKAEETGRKGRAERHSPTGSANSQSKNNEPRVKMMISKLESVIGEEVLAEGILPPSSSSGKDVGGTLYTLATSERIFLHGRYAICQPSKVGDGEGSTSLWAHMSPAMQQVYIRCSEQCALSYILHLLKRLESYHSPKRENGKKPPAIIRRDIHPENIGIDSRGQIDFIHPLHDPPTHAGEKDYFAEHIPIHYQPPESLHHFLKQRRAKKLYPQKKKTIHFLRTRDFTQTFAMDSHGIGTTLYFLLYHKLPYSRVDDWGEPLSDVQYAIKVLTEQRDREYYIQLRIDCDDRDPRICNLVQELLLPNPNERLGAKRGAQEIIEYIRTHVVPWVHMEWVNGKEKAYTTCYRPLFGKENPHQLLGYERNHDWEELGAKWTAGSVIPLVEKVGGEWQDEKRTQVKKEINKELEKSADKGSTCEATKSTSPPPSPSLSPTPSEVASFHGKKLGDVVRKREELIKDGKLSPVVYPNREFAYGADILIYPPVEKPTQLYPPQSMDARQRKGQQRKGNSIKSALIQFPIYINDEEKTAVDLDLPQDFSMGDETAAEVLARPYVYEKLDTSHFDGGHFGTIQRVKRRYSSLIPAENQDEHIYVAKIFKSMQQFYEQASQGMVGMICRLKPVFASSPFLSRFIGLARVSGDPAFIYSYIQGDNSFSLSTAKALHSHFTPSIHLTHISVTSMFPEEARLQREMQLLSAVAEILWGLKKVHDANYVHRDIKADNVLLNKQGHFQLIDYDLMHIAEVKNYCVGTTIYLPPECILDSSDPGGEKGILVQKTQDVWAIGIIIFFYATQITPFDGDDNTVLYSAILENKPPLLDKLFSPALAEAIKYKLLVTDPNERAKDADEVLALPIFDFTRQKGRRPMFEEKDGKVHIRHLSPTLPKFERSGLSYAFDSNDRQQPKPSTFFALRNEASTREKVVGYYNAYTDEFYNAEGAPPNFPRELAPGETLGPSVPGITLRELINWENASFTAALEKLSRWCSELLKKNSNNCNSCGDGATASGVAGPGEQCRERVGRVVMHREYMLRFYLADFLVMLMRKVREGDAGDLHARLLGDSRLIQLGADGYIEEVGMDPVVRPTTTTTTATAAKPKPSNTPKSPAVKGGRGKVAMEKVVDSTLYQPPEIHFAGFYEKVHKNEEKYRDEYFHRTGLTDAWAFGLLAHEMASGQPAFEGLTPMHIVLGQSNELKNERVSNGFQKFIRKLLRPHRWHRLGTQSLEHIQLHTQMLFMKGKWDMVANKQLTREGFQLTPPFYVRGRDPRTGELDVVRNYDLDDIDGGFWKSVKIPPKRDWKASLLKLVPLPCCMKKVKEAREDKKLTGLRLAQSGSMKGIPPDDEENSEDKED